MLPVRRGPRPWIVTCSDLLSLCILYSVVFFTHKVRKWIWWGVKILQLRLLVVKQLAISWTECWYLNMLLSYLSNYFDSLGSGVSLCIWGWLLKCCVSSSLSFLWWFLVLSVASRSGAGAESAVIGSDCVWVLEQHQHQRVPQHRVLGERPSVRGVWFPCSVLTLQA